MSKIIFLIILLMFSLKLSFAETAVINSPASEREGAFFTKPSVWINNPVKDKRAVSFYTSDDPARRLTILARTIYVPQQTAYEWAIDEVKSLTPKIKRVIQPHSVNIGGLDWVVIEWEDILNTENREEVKGQQYYSKKNATHTLIEVSVMGPKKVFDTVGTEEIYEFLLNAKIDSRSFYELKKDGFKNELENKSRPVSSADILGTWEMFYQKYDSHFSTDNPFVLPYQRFGFLPSGYLKSIGSTEPFDNEKMLRILWEAAPSTSTTYEILKPGVVLIGGVTGKYMTVISLITEDLVESLLDAPKLKQGDLVVAYVNPKEQVYLQRYLRKVGAINQNSSIETIVLKSGQVIEGKIIEKTDKYIKIDFQGVSLTYFFEDIETINGQKPFLTTEKTEASPADSVMPDSLKVQKDNQEAAENPETENQGKRIRDLPFTTVIITYKDKGETFNGEEIVYIDASKGMVSKDTRVEGKAGCVTKSIWKRDVCDGKTLSKIDLGQKKGASFKVKKGDAISNIFMEEMYLKYYKGQKIFLGKECKVYSSMPGEEFYFWEGILLKQKTTNHPMGKQFNVMKEAINIKLEVPIGDDKFKAPEGVKVMTLEETSKDMKKMLESLRGVKKEDWEKMMKDINKIKKD